MSRSISVNGVEAQKKPLIFSAVIPGPWLLEHSTPRWRIKDPKKGFQRVVKEERARKIAIDVLDQQRTFPNAIVLSTDLQEFEEDRGRITIPGDSRFLVVDGQHRLWAQSFSEYEAPYPCLIHMGLNEVEMARLFLEINDTQKRVPSSLRWDLVRLVRPTDDEHAIRASELVYELATERTSPLYQRIDLTGEQKEIRLKQGSVAPEIKTLVSQKDSSIHKLDYDHQYEVLLRYLTALRSVDPDGWREATSPLYEARVLRVLLRLLPLIIHDIDQSPQKIETALYLKYLQRIKMSSLSKDAIRAAQGSAGMKEIYDLLKHQMKV